MTDVGSQELFQDGIVDFHPAFVDAELAAKLVGLIGRESRDVGKVLSTLAILTSELARRLAGDDAKAEKAFGAAMSAMYRASDRERSTHFQPLAINLLTFELQSKGA